MKSLQIGIPVLLLTLCLCAGAFAESDTGMPQFTLHRAYYVEGPQNCQPSGLTMYKGDLYTVSDKHDDWIYRVVFRGDTAELEPARKIRLPFWSSFARLDFEGITHGSTGNFYLASEAKCRILKVPREDRAIWLTPDLKPAGREKGLFAVDNAHLEAISRISPDVFILCAERQPRGFLEVNLGRQPPDIDAYPCNESIYDFARGRSFDFSGLYWYRNKLYVLERNAFIISRLKLASGKLTEDRGWSYRNAVTSAPFRYKDMRYGKAEGLCIDDNFVYVILDNNGDGFAHNPSDRRPLLMIFNTPDDM